MQLRAFTFLLLALPCLAQINGGGPQVVQAFGSGTIGSTVNNVIMPNAPQSGHILIVTGTNNDPADTPTVPTDTLSTTFTLLAAVNDGFNNVADIWCGTLATSGADTVTTHYNGTGGREPQFNVVEMKNTTCTLDGAAVTNTTHTSASTLSTVKTTTMNGDVVLSVTGGSDSGGSWQSSYPASVIGANNENVSVLTTITAYNGSGNNLAGTYTTQHVNTKCCGGGFQVAGDMITVALEPASAVVTTTILPQAAANVAYSATLQSVGLSGPVTWSNIGSLPTGLSLSSGGVISGTTAVVGIASAQVQATDGSSTITATIPLQVALNFGSPTISQFKTGNDANQTLTFTSSMNCGEIGVIIANWTDTHFSDGWLTDYAGVTTHLQTNHGDTIYRITPYGGFVAGPTAVYVFQANTTASYSVTFTSPSATSNIDWIMEDVTGAQLVSDPVVFSTAYSTSNPITLATAYTTVVPNILLESAAFSFQNPGSNVYSAPFTQLTVQTANPQYMTIATAPASAVATYTSTDAITSANAAIDSATQSIFAIRPGSTQFTSCPAASPIRQHGVIL